MYPAIKTDAISEAEARRLCGDDAVDQVLALNCDYTNRVIDDVYEMTEFSASVDCQIDGEDAVLTVLYLEDTDTVAETEDLGNLSWDDYTFTIS